MMTEPTDQNLIDQYLSTGSSQAFEKLVTRHSGWVYALARRRVGSLDLADDVTQATFIVLATKARTLRGKSSIAAWLYRVARYSAIDALRRQSARSRTEKIAAKPEVTMPTPAQEECVSQHINQALDGLSEKDRQAVLLRYFNDQTLEQIGQVQNVAASTVSRRIERSLACMRHLLKKKGIAVSPAVLGAVMAGIGQTAAPPTATASISALALASGSLSISTAGSIGLAKGAIKTMTLLKIKLAAAAAVATLTVGTAGVLITQAIAQQVAAQPDAAIPQNAPATPADPATAASTQAANVQTEYAGEWTNVTLTINQHNPATLKESTKINEQSVRLSGQFALSDVTYILGFDRTNYPRVIQITNSDGNDVTSEVVPPSNESGDAKSYWFFPLSYSNDYDNANHKWNETPSPISFSVNLAPGPNLPEKLQQIQVEIPMLVCRKFRTVDVPFVAGGKPTIVIPGVEASFTVAEKDGQSYRYQLEAKRPSGGGSLSGQVNEQNPLPEQMVYSKYLVNAKGESLQGRSHPFGNFPSLGGENGSGGMDNAGQIVAMRFDVAEGLEIRMVTVTVNNVDLPNVSSLLNAVPAK